MIAEAPPPPLQIDAHPNVPSLAFNTLYKEPIILAPEQPSG